MNELFKSLKDLKASSPMIEKAIESLAEVSAQGGMIKERMRVLEILRDLSESGFITYDQYEAMIMDICMGDGSDI